MQYKSPRAGLVVVLCAAALFSSSGPTHLDNRDLRLVTFPGSNGAIAFIRDSNLWLMGPNGQDQTLLLDHVFGLDCPDWSPDGSRIALKMDRDIWIYTLAGGRLENLTRSPEEETEPAWSADGNQIAFGKFVNNSEWDVYVRALGASVDTRLTERVNFDGMPSWSPDGKSIAFSGDHPGGVGYGIYVMPAGTGEPETQVVSDASSISSYPDWSPDGSTIAYSSRTELYTVPASGGPPTEITQNAAVRFGLSWSPDGTQIAFSGGIQNYEILAWSSGGTINLTNSPATDDRSPDWSSAGFTAGTAGDDTIVGTTGDDIIYGGAGDDTIDGAGGDDTIVGGDGNDIITGDTSTRFGMASAQDWMAESGNDTIDGGAGNDRIDSGLGTDSVSGGPGLDSIWGLGARDRLLGGGGADHLYGGDDVDQLKGGAGNDILDGGAGLDGFEPGGGKDTCKVGSRKEKRAARACELFRRPHS